MVNGIGADSLATLIYTSGTAGQPKGVELTIRAWARQNGLEQKSLADLVAEEKVRALVKSAVDELNARLPRHESIRKFALLPTEFSVESGELTPSLKPRRRVIEQKYADVLPSLYEGTVPEAMNQWASARDLGAIRPS